jgi:hypothetical protein
LFDQVWIVRFRQAEPFCHAFHMGIDDDGRLAEGVAEYDICGFSADAWQGDQLSIVRGTCAEALGHGFAAGDEMFRFVLKETGGTNEFFEFRRLASAISVAVRYR